MPLSVEAIYENGVLKPVEVQAALQAVERSYGGLRWRGDREILEQIATEDEFGILESP